MLALSPLRKSCLFSSYRQTSLLQQGKRPSTLTSDFDLLYTSCLYSLKHHKQRETQQSAKLAEAKQQKMFPSYLTWLWLLNLLLLQVAADCGTGTVKLYNELSCPPATGPSNHPYALSATEHFNDRFDNNYKRCKYAGGGFISSISKDPYNMCVDVRLFDNENCTGRSVGGMSVSQTGCQDVDLSIQNGYYYQIFASVA